MVMFRKLLRRIYLNKCKIDIRAQQGPKLDMIVRVIKDNEVVEMYSMCIDKDDVSNSEMKSYVYNRLLEVKKW